MTEAAIKNLRESQQQLDADGTMVGVSRQALDEALASHDALAAALERIATEPVDYICCGNFQPGNHPEDEPQCCGSPDSNHEQIARDAVALAKKEA
jgi:hypothetical protein